MSQIRQSFTVSVAMLMAALSLTISAQAQQNQPAEKPEPKPINHGIQPSFIKDIVSFENIHDNNLVGYGIVVGLNGTGDTLRNVPMTELSIASIMERQGLYVKDKEMKLRNVAAVMVTAKLPAFAKKGSKIDVNVSSIGDASDLKGGTLLVTGLVGADGVTYAAAQGSLAVGGFTVNGPDGGSITQGVPTNGRIPNGAHLVAENDFKLNEMNSMNLSLTNPDFTTAKRIADAINTKLGATLAKAQDPSTVLMKRPVGFRLSMFDMIYEIENEKVVPDQKARIVIDERTGTLVVGQRIRVSRVAVAQANLIVRIEQDPVQGAGGAGGNAGAGGVAAGGAPGEIVQDSTLGFDDGKDKRFKPFGNFITVEELVQQLALLELGPRDIITIMQALKTAGALQAEIITM